MVSFRIADKRPDKLHRLDDELEQDFIICFHEVLGRCELELQPQGRLCLVQIDER